MDYEVLAEELLRSMFALGKAKPHRNITEAMRGEEIALNFVSMKGDDPVLPSELSGALHCSSARIAATLNSLEKKGLVTREIDPNNRRQILVRITEVGREQTVAHRREIHGVAAGMLSALGEKDALEYVRITKRLSELMARFAQPQEERGETPIEKETGNA